MPDPQHSVCGPPGGGPARGKGEGLPVDQLVRESGGASWWPLGFPLFAPINQGRALSNQGGILFREIRFLYCTNHFIGKMSKKDVDEGLEFLSNEGHIYSTTDEDHFKTTDS